jgi:hypothetical protein
MTDMFNHLKKTLQIAALQDVLHHGLELPATTANRLAQLAWENPGRNGAALRAFSKDAVQSSFFLAMTTNGQTDLLSQVAAEHRRFGAALDNYLRLQQLTVGMAA